jgi:hypothetical protein
MRTRPSPRARRRALLLSGLAFCAALPARAQVSGAAARASSPAVSSTRRFAVSGMTSGENVLLAAAAEEVAEKIESLVSRPLPFARGLPLRLMAGYTESNRVGRVVRAQGWADRALGQRLLITNPDRVAQEDLLEALAWLLLNRYVIVRQAVSERERAPGEVPEWFSVGVAQNLYVSLRDRNARVAVRRWQRGTSPSLEDLMDRSYLPEGRWSEKAYCGLAVDWIASVPRAVELFDALFRRWSAGESVTPAWLSAAMLGATNVAALEIQWDLRVARYGQPRRIVGRSAGESMALLEAVRALNYEALGLVVAPEMLAVTDLRQLVPLRQEPWLQAAAPALALKVRSLAWGGSDDFAAVVEAYARFFDALTERPARGLLARLLRRPASDAALRNRLARADRELSAFRRVLAGRTHYVDRAEGERAAPPGPLGAPVPEEQMERSLPRSELQRYVDEAERGAPR